jgi:hypothetical protein
LPKQHSARKNWASLRPGDRVTVAESEQFSYEATVEVLTEDARVIWVIPEKGDIRRAFDCREEITIRRISNRS